MERLISVFGLAVFVGLSYAFSVDRRAVKWSPVLWGIALQLILAILILKTAPGLAVFKFLGDVVTSFSNFLMRGQSLYLETILPTSFSLLKCCRLSFLSLRLSPYFITTAFCSELCKQWHG